MLQINIAKPGTRIIFEIFEITLPKDKFGGSKTAFKETNNSESEFRQLQLNQ